MYEELSNGELAVGYIKLAAYILGIMCAIKYLLG